IAGAAQLPEILCDLGPARQLAVISRGETDHVGGPRNLRGDSGKTSGARALLRERERRRTVYAAGMRCGARYCHCCEDGQQGSARSNVHSGPMSHVALSLFHSSLCWNTKGRNLGRPPGTTAPCTATPTSIFQVLMATDAAYLTHRSYPSVVTLDSLLYSSTRLIIRPPPTAQTCEASAAPIR